MNRVKTNLQRIIAIDALRGFALLGVLITNIFLFNTDSLSFNAFYSQFGDTVNQAAFLVIKYLFRGRFYPIFSFLFGLGLGLQYIRGNENGTSRMLLLSRLLVLMLFGVVHNIFIWDGDILLRYALAGLFVVFVAPFNKAILLASAISLYAFHSAYSFYYYGSSEITSTALMDIPAASYQHLAYTKIVFLRLQTLFPAMLNIPNIMYMVKFLAFMLFGLYTSKRYNFLNFKGHLHFWKRVWLGLLLIRLAFAAITYFTMDSAVGEAIAITLSFFNFSLNPTLYLIGFLIFVHTSFGSRLLPAFSAVGKMSLTNYIMQTAILSLVFYGYGLGFYQRWLPYQYLLFAVFLFALQVATSIFWLRRHKQGPLEAFWRSLILSRQR